MNNLTHIFKDWREHYAIGVRPKHVLSDFHAVINDKMADGEITFCAGTSELLEL
jgi:hypothetical protein